MFQKNPFMYFFGRDLYNLAVEGFGLNDPILVQFYNYYTKLLGLFWAWLIFIYIGLSIAFYAYNGIRFGLERINNVKFSQKDALKKGLTVNFFPFTILF